jgi:glyoxylate reductase
MGYNVFVTCPIPQGALDELRPHCDRLDVGPGGTRTTPALLLEQLPGRDGLICSISDRIDERVLAAAGPQCRVLASYGAGTDHIDLAAAARRGLVVTNTPGVLTDATADLTWALLLAAARRVTEGERLARSGRWAGWEPMQMHGFDVTGRTLGIVGAGRIGTAVGLRSVGFRMTVLYVDLADRPELVAIGARRVDLDTCLAQADFVTLHTPLTESTRHLISAAGLDLMKPTAVLINTARGPVVDQGALIDALRTGSIAAAGLDVYEQEPIIPDELMAMDNVVCLPHLGSATRHTRLRMGQMVVENLLAVLSGREPPNPVGA